MFEELLTKYDSVFQNISELYKCKKEDITIINPFNEGKSGDTVLLVRINKAESISDVGEYVLKIFNKQQDAEEESAKTIAVGKGDKMAHISIPVLRHHNRNYYIYDVAGEALLHATSLDKTDGIARANRIESISKYLLDEWNADMTSAESTVYELIIDWIGIERFEVGSRLNERIKNQITDELTDSYNFNNKTFPNPIFYLLSKDSPLNSKKILALYGKIHGDLNLNNIITQKSADNSNIFFMIDFDHFRDTTPLLFDQAYILFCSLLKDSESCTLIEWEELLRTFFESMYCEINISGKLAGSTLDSYMNKHLDAMKTFEVHQQIHNRKSFRIQLFAAHIAVGINFLNKRDINDRQQKMSLLYASEALLFLMKILDIEFENNDEAPMLHVSNESSSKLWSEINHFSAENQYILITSATAKNVSQTCLENLALARWSTVIEVNDLPDNELRNKVLPSFKKIHNYRFYDLPNNDSMVFEAASSWIHIFVPQNQKNVGLYYRNNFQGIIEKILKQNLKSRENDPIYLIGDLNGISEKLYNNLIQDILSISGENTPVKIITLDGNQIEIESDELITCYTSSFKLSDLSMALYSLKGSSTNQADPKIPTVDGMMLLSPETLANVSNDMELVYRNIIYNISDDGGDNFYHGSPASWYDLAVNRDVLRYDYKDQWKKQLISKMEHLTNGAGTILNLYHRAGGGGTTLSRRIAWDICTTYPTVILHKVNNQTSERLKEIYTISKKPLLVITEISDGNVSYDVIGNLRRDLIKKSIRILFLCVARFFGKTTNTDGIWCLPDTVNQCMSQDESIEMFHNYKNQLDLMNNEIEESEEVLSRKEKLSRLTYDELYEDMRQPFFYGLYTYEKDFHAIESYVNHNRNLSNSNEKKALEVLSLITLFSQSINLTLNEISLFLFPDSKSAEMQSKVANWIYDNDLVVRIDRGARICHPLIAEEILVQDELIQIDNNDGDKVYYGNDAIIDLVIEFIMRLTDYYGNRSERTNIIFREIFTHREMVYEEEVKKFSPFLTSLSKTERCVKIMKFLAETIPWNSHYSNHLARLYLYPVTGGKMIPNTKEALLYAKDAIEKAKKEGNVSASIHYHVLGKVYTKQCLNDLENLKKKLSVKKLMRSISAPYKNACIAFDQCIINDNSGYGITGKLELITLVISKICKKKNSNINGLVYNASKDNSKDITKMMSEAGDLIGQFYAKFDVSNIAFRLACINFYKLVGNINKIELILHSEAVTADEILNANRAISTLHMRKGFQNGSFSYDRMNKKELIKINKLMTENINMGNDSEQDRIRWFETYRRLPNSDIRTAYSFLMNWPNAEKNMFVCYYRYVYSFVLYKETGAETYLTVNNHLTQTKNLAQNVYGKNVNTSLNFYSKNKKDNYILPRNTNDIDESKDARIIQNKEFREKNCQEFFGIIASIVDNVVTIKFQCANENNHFFYAKTPNIDQISLEQDGYPVKFHLGFSYSGLRAWDVEVIEK